MSGDEDESMLPKVIEFGRAVVNARTRRAALEELGSTIGMWGLIGLAPTMIAATAQIHFRGLADAWHRFGEWWVLFPIAVAITPVAFALAVATLDAAWSAVFWVIGIVFYGIPEVLLGEERAEALFNIFKLIPGVAMAGFFAWIAWSCGADSAHHVVTHVSTQPGWDFSWASRAVTWARTNPLLVALASLGLPVVREILKKSGTKFVSDALKPQPARVVRIYGPDERVVREVVLDDQIP